MIQNCGRDGSIPRYAVNVGMRISVLEILVERRRQSRRSASHGQLQCNSIVVEKSDLVFRGQLMVNLHIELVPRICSGPYGCHEIVAWARKIWPHGGQGDNISGNPAESVSRNSVSWEWIANETRSARIWTSRSRIVD